MTSGALALATAGLLIGAFAACSVVDGWSELQGGRAGEGRGKDASTLEDSAGGDGGPDGNGGSGSPTCGAVSCPQGQGCCVSVATSAKKCSVEQECVDTQDWFFSCMASSSCPSSAPICCFDFGEERSSCLAGCGAGQYQLCSATDPRPCTPGACTTSLPGPPGIPACR